MAAPPTPAQHNQPCLPGIEARQIVQEVKQMPGHHLYNRILTKGTTALLFRVMPDQGAARSLALHILASMWIDGTYEFKMGTHLVAADLGVTERQVRRWLSICYKAGVLHCEQKRVKGGYTAQRTITPGWVIRLYHPALPPLPDNRATAVAPSAGNNIKINPHPLFDERTDPF